MSHMIRSNNISEAWVRAMRHLQDQEGETANLIVTIMPPFLECGAVSEALNGFLIRDPRGLNIEKTAATIFPSEFYLPDSLGDRARAHLYAAHAKVRRIEERFSKKGSYFDRMVRWPGTNGMVNQLDAKIEQYRRKVAANHRSANFFEVGISDPADDCDWAAPEGEAIRINNPSCDRSIMSFPCLSHVSITLSKAQLHMTAEYRNQYFIKKAYGNYVGLIRLLHFLAREIGTPVGELVCVATHADAEIGDSRWSNKSGIDRLMSGCEGLLKTTPSSPVSLRRIPALVARVFDEDCSSEPLRLVNHQ